MAHIQEIAPLIANLKAELVTAISAGSGVAIKPRTTALVARGPMQLVALPVIGAAGGTHPSVRYFPEGWNGYTFWMAYTPYPGVQNENPVILASNDGFNFVQPAGITNPIEPSPVEGTNSDVELLLTPDGKLRCYWRTYNVPGQPVTLYFKDSSNGVTWTNKTALTVEGGGQMVSPSLSVNRAGDYTLWLSAYAAGDKMERLTSADGITFTGRETCTTNLDGAGNHWHASVWNEAGKHYCLSSFRDQSNVTPYAGASDLHFGTSLDGGLTWEFERVPTVQRGQEGVNQRRVYRSCAVRADNRYLVYVSGLGNSNDERIRVYEADLST